jgi:hypothetical protein
MAGERRCTRPVMHADAPWRDPPLQKVVLSTRNIPSQHAGTTADHDPNRPRRSHRGTTPLKHVDVETVAVYRWQVNLDPPWVDGAPRSWNPSTDHQHVDQRRPDTRR